MSDWTALGAGAVFVAAVYGLVVRMRRVRPDAGLKLALTAASVDAMQRNQSPATIEHLALALLFDGEVAAIVRAAGGDPALVRRRLDEHLGSNPSGSEPPKPAFEPAVDEVLREAHQRTRAAARPRDVIAAMARRTDSFVGPLLPEASALVRARARTKRGVVDCDRASGHAYRDDALFAGDTRIRLFNDDQTTWEHVDKLLKSTFGLGGASSRYVLLRVTQIGSAAVGPWPREEAERLAALARDDARAKGFPLRVSIESA